MKNDNWTENEIVELNLMYTPHTKALLTNYVGRTYEGDADYSDDSLKAELLYLYRHNELDNLITAEWVFSEKRLKAEYEDLN